jgi:hypothetical protein
VRLIDRADVTAEDRDAETVEPPAGVREGHDSRQAFPARQRETLAQKPGFAVARYLVQEHESAQNHGVNGPARKDAGEDTIMARIGKDGDALKSTAMKEAKASARGWIRPTVVMRQHELLGWSVIDQRRDVVRDRADRLIGRTIRSAAPPPALVAEGLTHR